MKLVEPGYEILRMSGEGIEELKVLEKIGRVCYQSEPKAENEDEADGITYKFIQRLIKNGHEAILEHGGMTVLFTCDRGISHELVRHRVASFAQESTRWCNYGNDRFGNELTFIRPHYLAVEDEEREAGKYWWESAMDQAEESYIKMTECGYSAQEARAVLPNSLKTSIVISANWREWRHIFQLRCAKDAHPQMKEIMIPLLLEMKRRNTELFYDIEADWEWYAVTYKGYDTYEVFKNMILGYKYGSEVMEIL